MSKRELLYTPRNILLTGGAGFIGAHVVKRLVDSYPHYKIVVLDKLDYCASLRNIESVSHSPNFLFIKGDIMSEDLVGYILKTENIDTVMHFAAQTHVDNSFGNSFDFTKNNIYGTHVLLEGCRIAGTVKRFVHVSTDEVYGESSFLLNAGNTEAHRLEPTNPYAATKAGAEMLVQAYHTSYGLGTIVTRGNNVYGPGQYPEKLIPKFILMAQQGKQLPIHGKGQQRRSYLYVEDVAEAFDLVMHQGRAGEVYNIGTTTETTVVEVARKLCALFNKDPASTLVHVVDRLFNDKRYFLDVTKMTELGWQQKTSWDDGLKKTMAWYAGNDMHSYWPDVDGALIAHPLPMGARSILPPEAVAQNAPQGTAGTVAAAALLASVAARAAAPSGVRPTASGPVFLVYGRSGWIGGLLGGLLHAEGARYVYGEARLEDRGAISRDLQKSGATHVLCAAGVTGRPNVDWCESHKKETIRTNVIGMLNLADVASAAGVHVTAFATGCIYEYDGAHPLGSGKGFTEDEEPNFVGSYYSRTKKMVEELLREYDNTLVLRLRMPISSDLNNPRNFVYKISRYAKVVDVPNSMTVLDEMLPLAVEMAKRKVTGVYNFTNPGVISHNQVLALYKKYVDPSFKWANFSLEEQAKILAAPRSNNELDSSKLLKLFPKLRPIGQSLEELCFKPNDHTKKRQKVAHNGH